MNWECGNLVSNCIFRMTVATDFDGIFNIVNMQTIAIHDKREMKFLDNLRESNAERAIKTHIT